MDVLHWLKYTLLSFGIDPERNLAFECFRSIDGLALSSMTQSDFVTYSSTFGSFLYEKLQTYLRAENSVSNLYQRKSAKYFSVLEAELKYTKGRNGAKGKVSFKGLKISSSINKIREFFPEI